MAVKYLYRADGTKYLNPKWTGTATPTATKTTSGGGGGSMSASGFGTPTNPSGKMTDAERASLLRDLSRLYNAQFPPGKRRAVPAGLKARALKDRDASVEGIQRWMLDTKFKGWEKTIAAKTRGRESAEALDSIFGENAKIKVAFMKQYIWGDPGTMTWDRFLEKKVIPSKIFKAEHPGFRAWYLKQGGIGWAEGISKYKDLETQLTSWYKTIMQNPSATVTKSMIEQALEANISTSDQFQQLVVANDPGYLNTVGAKNKGEEFDALWNGIYGDDAEPDATMRTAWLKSAEDAKINDFFNNFIRTSSKFQSQEPDFEKWAETATGTRGGDEHVNPFEYYDRKRELKELYEVIAEKPGASNEELQRNALLNGWSNARIELEFKSTDPAYKGTAQAKTKVGEVEKYWKSIFGTDARPPADIVDSFVKGNNNDVTSTFDTIKQTAEFKTQYGNWGDFQQAQDYMGNTSRILANPELYKVYQRTFEDAFTAVGIEPPPEFTQRMFASGVDPDSLAGNMVDYVQQNESYRKMTGTQADMATAAGIGGSTVTSKAAGGELRLKMAKALEAHKAYTQSKFSTVASQQQNQSGLTTQSI